MNKFKEKEEPKQEAPKPPKKQSKVTRSVVDVVSGSFLSQEQTLKFLPFIFFLALMAICYIANGYYAEEKIRQLNNVNKDLKELRSEYITTKSDLMFISKQSEVAKAALELGIKESVVPPQKIIVKTDTLKKGD